MRHIIPLDGLDFVQRADGVVGSSVCYRLRIFTVSAVSADHWFDPNPGLFFIDFCASFPPIHRRSNTVVRLFHDNKSLAGKCILCCLQSWIRVGWR